MLIDRTFGIADNRCILDDVDATTVLALGRLVEETAGVNHVAGDAALWDLFRLELGFGGEVASIVVAEMVVGGDGQRLNTGVG